MEYTHSWLFKEVVDVAKKKKVKKNKGGRPVKYKASFNESAQNVCTVFGADDNKLAEFFKVTQRTIDRWKNKYLEFCLSIKTGKDIYDTNKVEVSLLERANGYEHEEEKVFCHNGEIVTHKQIKHYPPEVTAAIFWLKNRHPDRWRDIKAMELTGKGGGPIRTIEGIITKDMTEKEAEKVYLDVMRGDG